MAVEGPPPAKFQTSEFDITTEKVMKMDMIDRYTDILYIYIYICNNLGSKIRFVNILMM